jgi:uncharacterized protein (UPF0276 family)
MLASSEDLKRVFAYPIPRLVHSVGCPVGGSCPADHRQISLLRSTLKGLGPLWTSEHLSLNRACFDNELIHALSLLPPLQTATGIAQAARSIRAFEQALETPVAFETGVNYLNRFADELPDGEFIARVAEEADCGILLDLHNLLVNERNGRQSARDVVAQLPLERVWEIHVAGGFEQDGYWIDAHSGPADAAVLELLDYVLPSAPNLRAVIFEIIPSRIPLVSLDEIARHLKQLRMICRRRGPKEVHDSLTHRHTAETSSAGFAPSERLNDVSPVEWERALVNLVHGRDGTGILPALGRDPGIAIYKKLVKSFRRGMVSDVLTMTIRLLILQQGVRFVEDLFEEYWAVNSPEPFGSTEARGFAQFLAEKNLSIPYLADILKIECAALTARVERQDAIATVNVEPHQLLSALGAGHVPSGLESGFFELEITADESSESNQLWLH